MLVIAALCGKRSGTDTGDGSASRSDRLQNCSRKAMLGGLEYLPLFISDMRFEKLAELLQQRWADRFRAPEPAQSFVIFADSLGKTGLPNVL